MDINEIAVFLKKERIRRGYTRNKIIGISGLHRDTVIAIENGDVGYNIKALIAYCDAVNISINLNEIKINKN